METSQDLIWQCDAEGKYTYLNLTWETTFGYKIKEMLGRKPSEFQSPEMARRDMEEFERIMQGGMVKGYETIYVGKSGKSIHLVLNAKYVRDDSGVIIGTCGTAHDISERKQAEEDLKDTILFKRMILSASTVGILTYKASGQCVTANPAAAAITGGKVEELLKQDFRHIESWKKSGLMQAAEEALITNAKVTKEIHAVTTFRKEAWIEAHIIPFDVKGEKHFLLMLSDILDRKQAEMALSESEERFRTLANHAPVGIYLTDHHGNCLYANPFWCRMAGLSMEEALGNGWVKGVHPDDQIAVFSGWQQMVESEGQWGLEYRFMTRDGKVTTVYGLANPQRDESGKIIRYVGINLDITDRKRAEEAVRVSEERFSSFMEHLPACAYIKDAQGRHIFVNAMLASLAKAIGVSLLGKTNEDIWPLEMAKKLSDADTKVVTSETPLIIQEDVLLHGETRTYLSYKFLIGKESKKSLAGISIDITERKQSEEAIKSGQERLRIMLETSASIIICLSSDHRILEFNREAECLYGTKREEVLGKDYFELFLPKSVWEQVASDIRKVVGGEPTKGYENPVIATDGSEHIVHWSVSRIPAGEGQFGIMAVGQDITERIQAEEKRLELERQVQHAQKVNSLGVLAGGIAHDFNNLLTSILGYSDLVQLALPADSPAHSYIDKVIKGARRAAALTQQMLTYSGKGKVVVEVLDVSNVVEDMSRLLEVSISKKCELKYQFLEGLPSIEADVSQMRQVIMNLIINASEAIGDRSGVINVSTGVMYCDNTYLSGTYHYEKLSEGQYVYLEVSDNGCGMSEETRAKVFDPFFTTKFAGHGLGLSALLGIVRSHSGAVKVDSEPGRGTTFKVLFPASNKPAIPRDVPGVRLPHWCGRGFALIVDDEESVRGLARVMLEEMGFSVLTASDGREGVEVFRREAERISVVLLDMTMPRMDGEEAFREMRRIRNNVPTILSSGYNEKAAAVRFAGKGLAGFIQKPYGYKDLLVIVRKVLEG